MFCGANRLFFKLEFSFGKVELVEFSFGKVELVFGKLESINLIVDHW